MDIKNQLSQLGDKYLKYYLELSDSNKYKFNKLFNFNNSIHEYIIKSISLIEDDSILLFNYLFENICKNHFDNKMRFKCINSNCNYCEYEIITNNIIKNCPKCKSGVNLINEDKLKNTINYYLLDYEFYLLSNDKESSYLVLDKYLDKYYIKRGNNNFKDFIFYLLKNNNINKYDININYLAAKYGSKMQSNLIFDYIQDKNMINIIFDLGFLPKKEKFIEEDNNYYYNIYKGNKYLNMQLTKEEKEQFKNISLEKSCPNIYFLLNNLVNNNEDGYNYIVNYLSFVINNPNIRTEKVLSFYGEEETGKGLLYNFILNVLFEKYCSFITMKDLEENTFNEYFENKLFVFIDESYYNKTIENLMLNYTTCKEMIINKKHGTKKPSNVYFNFICASNKEIPMKVGKRRSIYFRSKTLGGSREQASILGEKLATNIPNEIDLFAKHLKSLDIDFKTINKGYDNSDKEDINEATKSVEERFIDEMFNYRSLIDFIKKTKNFGIDEITLDIYINNNFKDDFISIEMFLDLYNSYRKHIGLNSQIAINKFSWFYKKLDIDKEDNNQFKRGYNNDGKNIRWINKEIIDKFYNVVKDF